MAEVRRANGVSVEAGLLLNFGIRTAQIRARPHTISAIPKTFILTLVTNFRLMWLPWRLIQSSRRRGSDIW